MTANTEKAATIEKLQVAIDREQAMTEWEKSLQEGISHATAELESTKAEIGLT